MESLISWRNSSIYRDLNKFCNNFKERTFFELRMALLRNGIIRVWSNCPLSVLLQLALEDGLTIDFEYSLETLLIYHNKHFTLTINSIFTIFNMTEFFKLPPKKSQNILPFYWIQSVRKKVWSRISSMIQIFLCDFLDTTSFSELWPTS